MSKSLLFLILFIVQACGGEQPAPRTPAPEPRGSIPDDDAHPLCGRPIASPAEVWPRIAAVRELSDQAFRADCGLELIEIIAYWRCPPMDLLNRVVSTAAEDEAALVAWVRDKAAADSRLARHVVAMDIIGRWRRGATPDDVAARAGEWRKRAGGMDRIAEVAAEAQALEALLPKVNRIHELRCMLEVNPLGFAVACEPLHKADRDIDLNWHARSRDGLLEALELTRCTGSPACKKLKKRAVELDRLYRSVMKAVERLRVEVYREQLKEWLRLRPFE